MLANASWRNLLQLSIKYPHKLCTHTNKWRETVWQPILWETWLKHASSSLNFTRNVSVDFVRSSNVKYFGGEGCCHCKFTCNLGKPKYNTKTLLMAFKNQVHRYDKHNISCGVSRRDSKHTQHQPKRSQMFRPIPNVKNRWGLMNSPWSLASLQDF